MNIQIDAKGKQCPLPVIEAKNAISGMTEAGIVEVTVDNEIAVQNLTKMADHKGLKAKSEKKSDQEAEQRAAFSVSQYMSDEQCASLLDKVDRLEGTRSGSGF